MLTENVLTCREGREYLVNLPSPHNAFTTKAMRYVYIQQLFSLRSSSHVDEK